MKALRLLVSEKKNLDVRLLCAYVQTSDPSGRASFDPWGIICTNLVEVHKEMLNTKCQNSTPSSIREKEF